VSGIALRPLILKKLIDALTEGEEQRGLVILVVQLSITLIVEGFAVSCARHQLHDIMGTRFVTCASTLVHAKAIEVYHLQYLNLIQCKTGKYDQYLTVNRYRLLI